MQPAGRRTKHSLRRGVRDFAVVLAVFWGVAFIVCGGHGRAHAVPLPALAAHTALHNTPLTEPASLYSAVASQPLRDFHKDRVGGGHALLLLSLVFAGMTAFNLAFLRHLRRVYASPRRGVWRRGSQI